MKFRLWVGAEDYGTAAESQANMWLDYQKKHYPNEPAHIEEVADDAPVFLCEEDGPPVFEPLPPGHIAIWEPCGICGVTFIAGDVTMLVPKKRWTLGDGMTFEGALVHKRCYEAARG